MLNASLPFLLPSATPRACKLAGQINSFCEIKKGLGHQLKGLFFLLVNICTVNVQNRDFERCPKSGR